MEACETCGNRYDKPLKIEYEGKLHVYDSFECAIHGLAPTCSTCGIRILGHGLEAEGDFYCCANCARAHNREGLSDRQDASFAL